MLSTTVTTLDYTPFNLNGAQYSVSDSQGVFTKDLSATSQPEGGFVSNWWSTTRVGDFQGTSVAGLSGDITFVAPQVGPTVDFGSLVDYRPGYLVAVDLDGDWRESIRAAVISNHSWGESILPPAIAIDDLRHILPGPAVLAAAPTSGTMIADASELAALANEGGSIPIEPILANVGPGRSLESDNGLVAALSGQLRTASRAPSRVVDAVSLERSELSGEWARPMVLETAGGEPATAGLKAANDPSELPGQAGKGDRHSGGEPLSAHSQRAAGQGDELPPSFHRASNAGTESGEQRVTETMANARTARRPFGPFALQRAWADGESDAELQRLLSESFERSTQGKPETDAAAIPDAAFVEAFDQLARGEKADVRPADSETSWRKSLVAVPILMMLAVERIAAGSSRRASHTAARPAWRPLRSHHEPPLRTR